MPPAPAALAQLLVAINGRPGAVLLSIASGGENSLALLSHPVGQVIAIDRSPPQIAALELKMAAFRRLTHPEMVVLLVAHPGPQSLRRDLCGRCRGDLSGASQAFWDADSAWLRAGVLPVARFERYLALFRRLVLPLVHGAQCRSEALPVRSPAERRQWYDSRWDTWRWRWLFRLFFSRASLGALGTDPSFVRFGEESEAEQLLALVEGEPNANPYLHWILRGHYAQHLPLALRPEHFGAIRSRLDRLECRLLSLEDWLAQGWALRIVGMTSAMSSSTSIPPRPARCSIASTARPSPAPGWCSGTAWPTEVRPLQHLAAGSPSKDLPRRSTIATRCRFIGVSLWPRPWLCRLLGH